MRIYLASDHAGFSLKESLVSFLEEQGYEVENLGAHSLVEGDDYPEIIAKAAQKVSQNSDGEVRGIIFGKTGEGEAMVANRFPSVRAAVYYGGNKEVVSLSREHNDSNILSLGAGFISEEEAREVVFLWLSTNFSKDERHVRRIAQIESIHE